MNLSEREQLAASLVRAIGALEGCWVVSAPGGDKIRFQILVDGDRNRILQQIKDWGWEPIWAGMSPSERITYAGFKLMETYEISLPSDRPAIPTDRPTIHGEIAKPKKTKDEVEKVLRYLGKA